MKIADSDDGLADLYKKAMEIDYDATKKISPKYLHVSNKNSRGVGSDACPTVFKGSS